MNDFILTIHNETVRPNDHVSFLGDVTMKRGGRIDRDMFVKEMKKYNGHKRLFLGNHDHFPIRTYLDAGFEKIYATWRDESGLLFSHIPIHPSAMSYTVLANIHGHIHEKKSPEPVMVIDKKTQEVMWKPYINVSVEPLGYRPVSHEELMVMVRKVKELKYD